MSEGAGIRRAVAAAWITAIMAVGAVRAQSHPPTADTAHLDQVFPIGQRGADYTVVLDRSLSMKPYWPATVSALSIFAPAIPDGDHLALVTFDRRASNTLLIPRVLTPESRTAFLEEIAKVPAPARRKTDDDWNYTDLGVALSKTLDEINRPGANELSFVFLLTDFVHEPHPESPYVGVDVQSPAWAALVEKGKRLHEGKALQCFGLILPVDGRAGRDIGLVRAVLGDVPEVRVDATTLGAWFERMAQEVHRAKLTALVQADLSKGWEWSIRPDGRRTLLRLRSRLDHLPIKVTIERVALDGRVASAGQGQDRLLDPGAELEFPLEVSPNDDGVSWWRWLVRTGGVDVVNARVNIEGHIDLGPADELVRIGVEPVRRLEDSISGPAARPTYGAPLWFQLFVALSIVGASGITWRAWLRPVPPVRAFARRVILSGPGHSETFDLPADRKRAVVVGNTDDSTARSTLGSPNWAVTLVSRKPGFPRIRPRRGLYAHRSAGQAFYRGKEYDKGARRWVERDLPLPESVMRAVPVGFQTKLVIHHGGDRFVLTFHS
jgi:hypothetical protein